MNIGQQFRKTIFNNQNILLLILVFFVFIFISTIFFNDNKELFTVVNLQFDSTGKDPYIYPEGIYTIMKFNESSTFTVPNNIKSLQYGGLVIGGGGGGGIRTVPPSDKWSSNHGGSGGGVGFVDVQDGPIFIPGQQYSVIVGNGGTVGNHGEDSQIEHLIGVGGKSPYDDDGGTYGGLYGGNGGQGGTMISDSEYLSGVLDGPLVTLSDIEINGHYGGGGGYYGGKAGKGGGGGTLSNGSVTIPLSHSGGGGAAGQSGASGSVIIYFKTDDLITMQPATTAKSSVPVVPVVPVTSVN